MSDKKTNAAAPVAALKSKVKLIKGVFLVSPTAVYKLAYSAGEEGSLPELQALELEEAGYFKPTK
jgi:hypothetical protein